ncbi:MAG: hypothetical protein ABI782_09920 [Anaerolineaceae bacterium]
MTEPLQVGQFAIVDGEPVDRGPNAGVFHGKGPADDRAELYILAEGTSPASDAFAGHVVSAVGQAFGTFDMSLTGSLMRLFEEAERNLRDWNQKSIAQHRVSLGLTALGRRGGQAVIAQAGPSAAFHLHQGKLDCYFTQGPHAVPIGAGPVDAQLTRVDLKEGDRVLLLSSQVVPQLDVELIEGVLGLSTDSVLGNLYQLLKHVRNMTAVLVTGPVARKAALPIADVPLNDFVIDATAGQPPAGRGAEPRDADDDPFQPVLFIDDTTENVVIAARRQLLEVTPRRPLAPVRAMVAAAVPAPLLRVSGEQYGRSGRPGEAEARAADFGLAHATAASASTARPGRREAPLAAEFSNSDQRRRERRDSFTRGLRPHEAPPLPGHEADTMPRVEDMAAEHRARSAVRTHAVNETLAGDSGAPIGSGGSLVRVRGNMGRRWKGGDAYGGRGRTTGSAPPPWLVMLIGLGILVVLVGFATLPGMFRQDTGQQYASLLQEAQTQFATAGAQQDPAERRKALSEAQAKLLQARELRADGPEETALTVQVNAAIVVADAVKAPASVEVIASLGQFGDKPVAISRMSIGSERAYLLDSASGQVISIPLAGGEPKVVYTEDKDAKRGRPLATAYLEVADGVGAELLIADASRQLWSFTPANGIRQLTFAAPTGLTIDDIATFGRDLYVLDSAQSTVYRFAQNEGAFGAAPAKLLQSPDLASARRLTFDGEILTADVNGTIHRFSGQLAMTLSGAGIDKRLLRDESVQSLAKNGELAVLDATNDRIVVFRRDGLFSRQYKHKDFRAASAFAVKDGTAYLFSDGKLRRVTW